jgi:hypothetical protein
MSRLTDALLTGAYQRENDKPVLDLRNGGQHGWSPNIEEFISNQAYISRPLTCILLEPPKMFSVMPDSEKWVASLKALFELHARSIDGFSAGLSVDTEEHPLGGAGEQQQEITNVTRERSQPKFTFIEKYGRPIQSLIEYWIRYGMMDPDTKYALLGTMGEDAVKDLLADWYSATCLFFVTDPLFKKIDKAWVTTNMFPLGTGDITAKRDLTAAQEMLTLDIDFSGISQFGLGVNQFAQGILDNVNTLNADPFMKPSFVDKVSPDVEAVGDTGYKAWTEQVGSTAVTSMGS